MPKGPFFDSAVDYHGHSKHVHIELFLSILSSCALPVYIYRMASFFLYLTTDLRSIATGSVFYVPPSFSSL